MSRLAHAASTAATPSTKATTRRAVSRSRRNAAASSAVATGFIATTTAHSTAGAPRSMAKYSAQNCTACIRSPVTATWPSLRPVGKLTPAMRAQAPRMMAASPKRNASTAIGVMAPTAMLPIG